MTRLSVVALLGVLGSALAGCASHPSPGAAPSSPHSPPTRGSADSSALALGFAAALPGYHFRFPFDAGAHPQYRTEWWYYTGRLHHSGHTFGFELTFFRVGLTPHPERRASRWAASAIYLAHFAITDVSSGRFYYTDRVDRGALGLAGAAEGHEQVWIGDWGAQSTAPAGAGLPGATGAPAEMWPHDLHATSSFGAVNLRLSPQKPPVIEGRQGVSLKGPGRGQATHYYSYTRLTASGAIRVSGQIEPVTGLAWMDHEFGSSQLSPDETGWDWFSAQLSDGWDLMLYQLRLAGGPPPAISPFSSGALISPTGKSIFLSAKDFTVQPRGTWRSPHTAVVYPSGWEVRIPSAAVDLRVEPLIRDQELTTNSSTGVLYWEGAVSISGRRNGAAVTGGGYTELTGYGGALTQLR